MHSGSLPPPPNPHFIWGEQGKGDRGKANILSLALLDLPVGLLIALRCMGLQLPEPALYPEVQDCLSPAGAQGLSNASSAGASPLLAGP